MFDIRKTTALITLALFTFSCSANHTVSNTSQVNNKINYLEKLSIRGKVEFPISVTSDQASVTSVPVSGIVTSSSSLFTPHSSPVTRHSSPFTTQATLGEVGIKATVSLITSPDASNPNVTIATGLTDSSGAFTLNLDSYFTPVNNQVYILEAAKRHGTAGNYLMSVRTYVKWNGSKWVSITYSTVLGNEDAIVISTKTTALTIMDSYESVLSPAQTIHSVDVTSGSSVPDAQIGGSAITGQKVIDIASLVNNLLIQNIDPVKYISFTNGYYYVNGEANYPLNALNAGFNCPNCDLSYEDLSSKNYDNKNLRYANLQWSKLANSSLQGADLTNSNISWADLSNTNLTGTNLTGAILAGTDLTGANLTGANLTGANWINSIPPAPNVLSASNITTSSFTASWNAIPIASGYKLFVDGVQYPDTVTIINTNSKSVSGLLAGSSHTFYISSVNSAVTGSVSGTTSVTLIPSSPVASSATNITSSSFTANWNNVTGATSYKLFVNGSQYPNNSTLIGTNSYNVTGLNAKSIYSYYVVAVNSAGVSTNSNSILFSNAIVTTLAGNGSSGTNDGSGTNAQFNHPQNLSIDSAGNLYIADSSNHRVRKVTSAGVVTNMAGNGNNGDEFIDGNGTNARFNIPYATAVVSSGNVYVADYFNGAIRKIDTGNNVTTLTTTEGDPPSQAQFVHPSGIVVDSSGNIYVSNDLICNIKKITPEGVVTTVAGGSRGYADGNGTDAQFSDPSGLAIDLSGNLYVADFSNSRIRKVTPEGIVTTVAGDGTTGFADGNGTNAKFNKPTGIAVDSSGNLYVADYLNNRIRKITTSGVVTTLAGNSAGSFSDGAGTNALFNNPSGIAIDNSGNLFVTDNKNNRIRKIE